MRVATRSAPKHTNAYWQNALRNPRHERVIAPRAQNSHEDAFDMVKMGATAFMASTLFLTASPNAVAREHLVRAPLATTPELQGAQRVMIEAWNLIRSTYVDPSFNHVDWEKDLIVHLEHVASSSTLEEGERELKDLVSDLGDVYTRWMPSSKYQEFLTDSINSEVCPTVHLS